MPWNASRPVDLKVEFMRRFKGGESMSELCREFGIHRQTGYEVVRRFESGGVEALLPRSRRPLHSPSKTAAEVVALIVEARRKHPTWGARKLKRIIETKHGLLLPAESTVSAILKREGLIEPRRSRAPRIARPTGLRDARAPNEVWCMDYKGQFRLGDRSYCYPFTATDQFSRFILCCDGMAAIDEDAAIDSSLRIFRSYGLPETIRTDNGSPFASTGLANLSRLSALFLRLGIELERIDPGHPEQNGQHERMHRTLKRDTTRPAKANLLQQQERFDEYLSEFNQERPHEALDLRPPAQVYASSTRPLREPLEEPAYPFHDDVAEIGKWGELTFRGRSYKIARALRHQLVGLREQDDGTWLVTFMTLDLGTLDHRSKTFQPIETVVPPTT